MGDRKEICLQVNPQAKHDASEEREE